MTLKIYNLLIEMRNLNEMSRKAYLSNIYLFKVNNENTRKRCEICSKLIIKTPERRHIVDFEPASWV